MGKGAGKGGEQKDEVKGKAKMVLVEVKPKDTFMTECKEAKAEVEKLYTSQEVNDDLQEIIMVTKILFAIGMACISTKFSLVGIVCLAAYEVSQWAIIGHHCSHGSYNKHDPTTYYHRGKYALGFYRRFVDWFDCISPEGWNIEHNKLHHYRLNEVFDPDLVIVNVGHIRKWKGPEIAKFAFVFIAAATWKLSYYCSNTYRYYYFEDCNVNATDSSNLPRDQKGLSLWGNVKFLANLFGLIIGPYLAYKFFVIPMVFYFIHGQSSEAFYTVLKNMLCVEVLNNLWTFCIIVPNHCGDDIFYFDTPVKLNTVDFYVRCVTGSANYHTGTKTIDFMQGYLNYQIEHHMFPDLAPIHLRAIQPKIKEICKKHDVPYVQQHCMMRVWKTVCIMVGRGRMINSPESH